MKIFTILGARPQFIKAIALSRAFQQEGITEEIIHTGQHYDKNLGDLATKLSTKLRLPLQMQTLKHGAKSEGTMLGDMISELSEILDSKKVDAALVYGDTTSTLAGALASAKAKIPLIHIESGLRSFDPSMSEEQNRILTDHLSHFLFCPSDLAIQNLKNEGITRKNVVIENIGDIMLESKNLFEPFAKPPRIKNFDPSRPFFIASIHRSENVSSPLQKTEHNQFSEILSALNEIAKHTPLLFITHPRNQAAIKDFRTHTPHILFIPPQDYFSMLFLLRHTQGVITDSGGLQKEAYFFHKRALVIRQTTEWQELILSKAHKLSAPNQAQILEVFATISQEGWLDFSMPARLYGDGKSTQKIIATLKGNL